MKLVATRVIGLIFVIAAVTGMLISGYVLIRMWQVKPDIEATIRNNLAVIQTTVETTSAGLVDIKNTVDALSVNATSLQTATLQLAQTIHDTHPMVDSLNQLMGHDLPQTISSTQTSLASAQGSALLIDNMLTAISRIPLLGLGRYAPSVPLHESLAQVSSSLDKLNPSLAQIHTSLETANTNISLMETQVISISLDIQKVNQNLASTQPIIAQYQEVSGLLLAQTQKIQARLSGWLNTLAWLITLLTVWIFVTQIGLLVQGLELMGIIRPRYRM